METKDLNPVLETLRMHMTYRDLPENVLTEMAILLERQFVRKGEFIFQQGDDSEQMHLVESGLD